MAPATTSPSLASSGPACRPLSKTALRSRPAKGVSLWHVSASVDVQHLAGRGVRVFGGEKDGGARDLVGRQQLAAERDGGACDLDQLAVSVAVARLRRVGGSRR